MNGKDYMHTLVVPNRPQEVYDAIARVTEWWTINLEGATAAVGDEFTVEFGDVHRSVQRITEAIPGQRMVWHVTEAHLPWLKDMEEWTGTSMSFEISPEGNGSRLEFVHAGLTPQVECYLQCVKGWDYFIGTSLWKLLTEGKGLPDTTARSHMDTIGHVRPKNA